MAKSCQKRSPYFDSFLFVSCVFSPRCDLDLSLFYFQYLFISSYFSQNIAQHSTQHTQYTTTHAHKHAHLPLTVILRVVWFRDRRANRSSSAKCRKTNRTIWLMVPSEVSLILRKKRMIRGIGNVLFSTCSQTSNGHDHVVSPGEPLEQVITPRGPISVSLKLAMKDEPNIGLRSCSG